MKYNPVELIIKKRSGQQLTRPEMKFFVESYLEGKIPEYQMSSFLMAIFFQGMEPEEVQILTEVYINSGKRINFPPEMKTVDKHSTGGVGDKISIPLAPIVAACGGKIPMISGRGLGHTGGTLDKLESIPGFRTDFSDKDFIKFVNKVGFSIIGQSEELVPADRRIYALRDVSGTVESLPLITASIMSKKIAEGAQNLVIDLKVGSGAFIKNMEQAEKLAFLLMQTGEKLGQKVSVVFTDMNSPLGKYAGNALEIKESIEFLRGEKISDIYQITKTLAVEMLLLSEIAENSAEAGKMFDEVIANGNALEKFREFIRTQGGNPRVCDDVSLLPQSKHEIPIIAEKTGWVKTINSQEIGYALVEIDAGRKTLESKLNYAAGAFLPKKIGDYIEKGEMLAIVYCDDEEKGKIVGKRIKESYTISDEKIEKRDIILKIKSAK
ncbi:MAG: thymidine phosphorylase [Candidatus Cloacimonadota bacterium]|nr:MAG: thymidine phosphorylase [Candidatus Cloacimonadota bacterium]